MADQLAQIDLLGEIAKLAAKIQADANEQARLKALPPPPQAPPVVIVQQGTPKP